MGQGVGQRGARHRSEEAFAPGGTQAVVAEEVGSREDFLVARAEQEAELRDYERLPESSEAFIYIAMRAA